MVIEWGTSILQIISVPHLLFNYMNEQRVFYVIDEDKMQALIDLARFIRHNDLSLLITDIFENDVIVEEDFIDSDDDDYYMDFKADLGLD